MSASDGITRRQLLGAGAAAGIAVVASSGVARAATRVARSPVLLRSRGPQLPGEVFTLGVASGEPLHDRVVLWTRLAPDVLAPDGGMGTQTVPVKWQVARDEGFKKLVASGKVDAVADDGHSVHVDAKGLDADHQYFYRFRAGDQESPVGRTRTAPAARSTPKELRFAFSSCQNYQDGYYAANRHMAEEDVAFVAFLGDYIYESGPNPMRPRQHEGPEPIDLPGYRVRYARYKSDPDLQAAHAAAPWIVTWDDHEVENNYATDQAQNHTVPPDQFLQRRAQAYKAWWENQPVRLKPPTGPDYKIYRTVKFGELLDVHVLDTRQYRSDQVCGSTVDVGLACPDIDAPTATLMGEDQERWLGKALKSSKARWDVLAQQVMVGRVNLGGDIDPALLNLDQWDGYVEARARLLEMVEAAQADTVVITGDIHTSWVNDLKTDEEDPASKTIGTEFVGTSITSRGDLGGILAPIIPDNPTVKYFDGEQHGYSVCSVKRNDWTTSYRYVSDSTSPDATIATGATFVVERGHPGVLES